MEIYALEGHKVMVTEDTKSHGHDHDKEAVKEHLEVGKVYTVQRTYVSGYSTKVTLKELPDVRFNSVNFKDVDEHNKSKNNLHPDWEKFHKFI